MTTSKSTDANFAGLTQVELLESIMHSAESAAAKAVAENDQRGLDSPGSRNGKIVFRKSGGKIEVASL